MNELGEIVLFYTFFVLLSTHMTKTKSHMRKHKQSNAVWKIFVSSKGTIHNQTVHPISRKVTACSSY